MHWEMIWKSAFILTLAAFAVMSILVTVFGARDIKRLLKQLDKE